MYTIVVAGGDRVGKSSITQRFVRDQWLVEDRVNTSTSEVYIKQMMLNEESIPLAVADTASSTSTVFCGDVKGDAFVFVFSINDRESFNDIIELREAMVKNGGCRTPITIVGNKCDLESERQVESSTAYLLAHKWSSQGTPAQYIEASAKEDCNTLAIFRNTVESIRTQTGSHNNRLVYKANSSSSPRREKVKRRHGIRRALTQIFLGNRIA
eukprot:TRINITY_DN15704_c0_g1_i1.p1 TRINITY_DN15704_c0_g1~~TRINITY_DN15704_c0_g1_i1.p1  ORF type:complete len:212 (+),score=37.50 TRINITY_DN15704_c0_g1_i1:59-694(+)